MLRARRRAVSPAQRAEAARRVALHAQRAVFLHPGQRIALYSPIRNELDVAPLRAAALRRGCEVYVPCLTDYRARRMRFVLARGPMRPNRLGILEPDAQRAIGTRWLDVVFVPLLGFDAAGMRLGMGAGYYDRALAFRRLRQYWRGPRLIGLAYAFQQLGRIESAAHDVPLDAVVTDAGVLECVTGC